MEAESGTACIVQPHCPSDEFPCQMRLSEKIAPVKTCFKKKQVQKRLSTGTLRTLRPILNTLLESGSLDGVFMPMNPSGNGGSSLCQPTVKKALGMNSPCPPVGSGMSILLSGGADVGRPIPEADPSSEDTEQVVPSQDHGFPSETTNGTVPDPAVGAFQDPLLHTATSDVPVSPDCTEKAMDCIPGLFQQDNYALQYNLNTNHKLNTGLFQGKSEEASLDLVFELLNQLQYHTHQENGIEICMDFLQGSCVYGSDCLKHHTVLPYHWQVKRTASQTWQSVTNDSQEHLERLFCNPDNDRVRLKYRGHEFWADLNAMSVYETTEFDQIRRLSTPSSFNVTSNYHTVWKYFCRDHFGWREYPESIVQQSVIRLIEETSFRGLREVRFSMLHHQYVLNVKDNYQQSIFSRRIMKKRPLLRSCLVLMPYLQTLGGTPLLPLPAAETASSQAFCPSVVTSANFYPETWIAMDPSQDFIQVPVSKEDKSYRTIYNLFHKTVPEIKYRILKILRVQNQFLWEKYKRKKEYMSKKANDISRIMNERHLFHGTSQDVVDGICKHNFDPRVCGKHATMFGQGSYFARKASYSHSFSKRSPKGVHFMFLAKVLTGRYTVGNHNMRRPPPVNPDSITSDLYDSCVDNYFEPQIFVIFNDDQSYPYFVIQYEEVSNTVTI
ncbi:protein mono-ADP-ribosyltransferase TIPARP isoform X1 [Petaurus breviceps papuanus]|uniref:protein mono-ADP-ribosyltransferase TIPARP isoform X1 n=1 Tax=Petaurus breviceps papuanus TaxID=3040969 RepID=UPI0036D7F3A1